MVYLLSFLRKVMLIYILYVFKGFENGIFREYFIYNFFYYKINLLNLEV